MNKLVIEMLELRVKISNQIIDLSNYLKKTILSFEVLTNEKNINLRKNIEDDILVKSRG